MSLLKFENNKILLEGTEVGKILVGKNGSKNEYTPDSKKVIVAKVDELEKGGTTLSKAVEDVGITLTTYNNWSGRKPKKRDSSKKNTETETKTEITDDTAFEYFEKAYADYSEILEHFTKAKEAIEKHNAKINRAKEIKDAKDEIARLQEKVNQLNEEAKAEATEAEATA